MRRRLLTLILAVAILCAGPLAGCASRKPVYAEVRIGPAGAKFRVEVAQTQEQQRDGLAGRRGLSEGTGMLFQFDIHSEQQVWMVGMTFPLDIAWIADGRVMATDTLSPCADSDESRCPRWTSPRPVDALLEVPAGSLTTVVPGMTVTIHAES